MITGNTLSRSEAILKELYPETPQPLKPGERGKQKPSPPSVIGFDVDMNGNWLDDDVSRYAVCAHLEDR